MDNTVTAAQKFGKTPAMIRWLAQKHQIGVKIGRDWLFDDADMARLATCPKPGRPRKTANPAGAERPSRGSATDEPAP